MTNNSFDKNKTLGLAGVLIIVFGIQTYSHFYKKTISLTQSTLEQMSSEINKTCPRIIDSETVFNTLTVLPGMVLRYNYSLMKHSKDEINIDVLKNAVEPSIMNSTKTNPELKLFRDEKVTFIYSYSDRDANYLFDIKITPEKYAQ